MMEVKAPHPNALNAMAIQMRNQGQNAVFRFSGPALTIREWLEAEFDRYGYDKSEMAVI